MTYPKASTTGSVPASPRFPQIEQDVLARWEAEKTFRRSIENRDAGENGSNEFVFFDGPPFANGLPHYGHLLTGYVKDVVPRYQTMRGRRVERRFGWDTHGLPAELEAMRQLGMTTKDEIVAAGIGTFNDACRTSVLRYTSEWEEYVTRMGRWVDFEGDYKTLNPEYMESVIWAFKQLYDKGLAYEGFRVLPYCWNDETPLSNHELRMDDDVYQQRQDPSVTLGYRLETGELLLVWTTTPWTTPSNQACAVNTQVQYVVVESSFTGRPERYVLAEARLAAYARELADEAGPDDDRSPEQRVLDQVVGRLTGAELVGRRYTPPFTYFTTPDAEGQPRPEAANAWQVLAADYVTTDDGTGAVHIAPAFGEEDKNLTDQHDIRPAVPVDAKGEFTHPVTDYAGLQVFDANPKIVEHLKNRTTVDAAQPGDQAGRLDVGSTTEGTVLLRHDTYAHSYPHCWRCRKPLIYKAVSSWFVEVTKIKQRLLENNEQITWVPEHVKHGQFGKWLEGARDWSISRNRFWGSPIPVWKSDNPEYPRIDVYGSFAELDADFGRLPVNDKGEPDLHRPFIDELTRPNPDDPSGQSTMRRVEDVLDVWFDSGSMSFAQNHMPFENAEWFEHHFPADFIVEYIGQTRGWFYTMHVMATALFDRPAFESVICHGIVLGNDGQKMSKSLRNYPDVTEVFERDGADAMRWFLMASPILRGGNLVVTEQGIRDGVRQVLIPLWNAWYFFQMYANAAGVEAHWSTASTDVLDRYALARTGELVERVTAQMDVYDIAGACESVREHLDVLTNWYIRRSRERFWAADGTVSEDTQAAFDTLYTCLEVLCRVGAPLLPFVTDEIHRGLTGGESVHLTDWPEAGDLLAAAEGGVDAGELGSVEGLVGGMDRVQEVCSAALALRKAEGLRVRLPLSRLTVVTADPARVEALAELVRDEVNVKEVVVEDLSQVSEADFGVEQRLTVNARAAGPRLGKDVQRAIKGSKSGDWSVGADGVVTAGGLELVEGEYTLETVAGQQGGSDAEAAERVTGVLPGGGFVVLDTAVTEELAREGLARDVIRAVQQARRDAGLDVSDRISLTIAGNDDVWDAVMAHQGIVLSETLTTQFGASGAQFTLPADTPGVQAVDLGEGRTIQVLVAKR